MNWPDSPTNGAAVSTDASDLSQRLSAWWQGLDTDWKSVFVAAAIVTVSTTTDVPLPA